MKHFLLYTVALFFTVALQAQTPLPDTIIEGDLDVRIDSDGKKGSLTVEGELDLATLPVSMDDVKESLALTTADYYGPISIGDESLKIQYVFEKDTATEGNAYLDLPLGRLSSSSRVKVIATVNSGGNYESAEWVLTGSRHRQITCMNHTAYGFARHFELKGTMHHGSISLYLDLPDSLPYSADRIMVSVEAEIRPSIYNGWDIVPGYLIPDNMINGNTSYGNSIEPVNILESTIYEKLESGNGQTGVMVSETKLWNGTHLELDGEVIIKQAQGDISMGAFGE